MMHSVIEGKLATLAARVKVIVTDVDGVLNDGRLYLDANGEEVFAAFNIYDGFGVILAHDHLLRVIVISGRHSACTIARCRNLGIDEVYTGVKDKKAKLQEIVERLNLSFEQMVYIGDDLIDLSAMGLVGFKVAPKTAMAEVISQVDYVTATGGGKGVLREVINLILGAKGINFTSNFK